MGWTLPERLDQPLSHSAALVRVAAPATLAEWLSGWVAASAALPEWLSGWVAGPASLAEWLSGWVAASISRAVLHIHSFKQKTWESMGQLPWFGILLGQICPKRFVAATRDPHAPAVIAMVGDESHELQCLHLDHYPGNCPVNIMKGACYSCLATSSRTARGQTSGFLLGWGDTDHMKSLAGRVWELSDPTKNHWGAAAEVHKVYLVYFLGTHSSKVHKQVPTGPACQMAFPLAATAIASNCPRRPWWWGTAAQGGQMSMVIVGPLGGRMTLLVDPLHLLGVFPMAPVDRALQPSMAMA